MDPAVDRRLVGDRGELAVVGRQPRGRDPPHQLLLLRAVLDEVLDGDELESVPPRKIAQLGQAGHAAGLVEHLADHAGGIAARHPREVHRRLRVPGAAQHAALHRAQREHVSGCDEIGRGHLRIGERADGDGPVVGGDTGGDAAPRVHADREGGAHRRGVLGHHHAELELVQPLAQHRHAHEPARVRDHEVDGLGGDLVGGHDEVALVLPVLVVDDDQDAAVPDLLDRLVDGREAAHHAPFTASDRCTYLPITSVSMLTARPAASRPSVVTASVCGISITSKAASSSDATVRLTPSTATEPWGISSGASPRSRKAILTRAVDSTRVTASTVPVPSTWPRTRCPPSEPPKRSGRSRLTAAPGRNAPSAVLASVSGPISKARPSGASGATNSATRPTTPASRNDACTSPPPSTSTARTSRSNSAARIASTATRPARTGQRSTVAPADCSAVTRAAGARSPTAMSARDGVAPAITWAPEGVRASVSRTTRHGSRGHGRPSRTVSAGSARSTVVTPTTSASASRRCRCASARAASPVTQRAAPCTSAILPSALIPALSVTCGRRSRMAVQKTLFWAAASAPSTPVTTATPCPRRAATPPPRTNGLGSAAAATTRVMPAAKIAGTHGGVRPAWLHGSSVT